MVFIGEVKEKRITSRELMTFKGHFHPQWEELMICLEGLTGVCIGSDKEYYLPPGHGILLEPGKEHIMWDASKKKQTSYYNAYYSGFLPIFRNHVNTPFNAKILGLKNFWNEDINPDKPVEKKISEIMTLLLAINNMDIDKNNSKESILGQSHVQNLEENIRTQLANIIQGELGKKHTLEELGERFFLEPKYLSQKIKKISGKPAMTFYFQLKMEEAVKMLTSGLTVKETAFALGFKNPYHFSRKFKEITHLSPSSIRSKQ